MQETYVEDVQPSVNIQHGMMVEIKGKTYKVDHGFITENGAILPGDLRKLVLSGKAILKT